MHTAEKEGAGLDIRYLKGVGEKRAAQLTRLGIRTVDDLLGFYPRDYVDYSHPYPVAGAPYDVKCVVRATVYGKNGGARIRGGRQMAKATAGDDTAGLILTYFNNPYALQKLEVGREYLFFGKVGGTFTAREMVNPVMLTVESAAASPLVPVYPQTEGVSSAYLAKCVRAAFAAAPDIEEPLPAALIEKYRLCGKAEALQKIHFPQSRQDVQAARRRLIFEELLALQLGLLLLRRREAAHTGAPMRPADLSPFWNALPFAPTGAQRRAAQEILADLGKKTPMNRLLQGDVGSGKTLVAAAGVYAAAQSGYQSVLMAPTEILAAQHADTLDRLLAAKADHPHLLVMSATPIPRTLGLLMFGDLDISVLDELPPGRTPVKTYAITGKKRADMYGFVRRQLAAGRQAYIVCPVIDEGENDMQAVTTYYTDVAQPLLEHYRVGLMHGRLKAAEKAAVMDAFKAGALDVLVSTTVIEVGVDVPNANIIVIENAERYGLSALHQLRGRVGRGKGEAYCVLISDHATDAVKKRLSFLCHTNDGFEIAKFDLETRGPGDFFGSRQHGLPTLRIADLMADSRALYAAQKEALALVGADPALRSPGNAGLRRLAEELFSGDTALN